MCSVSLPEFLLPSIFSPALDGGVFSLSLFHGPEGVVSLARLPRCISLHMPCITLFAYPVPLWPGIHDCALVPLVNCISCIPLSGFLYHIFVGLGLIALNQGSDK